MRNSLALIDLQRSPKALACAASIPLAGAVGNFDSCAKIGLLLVLTQKQWSPDLRGVSAGTRVLGCSDLRTC